MNTIFGTIHERELTNPGRNLVRKKSSYTKMTQW